nr:GLPGLI family protein [Pedobacter roseus]
MLKKFKIFFLLLCTASGAIAQGNNPALGQVTYAFRTAYIKTDSGIVAPTSYQVANYRLLFGQNSSLYSLISRPVNTVNFTSGIDTAELFKNKGARDLVYKEISKVVPSNAKGRETNYLKKYGSRLLTRQEIGTTNEKYLILDTVPEINWQVSEETKVILSYSCQKAVGSFRGATIRRGLLPRSRCRQAPGNWEGFLVLS